MRDGNKTAETALKLMHIVLVIHWCLCGAMNGVDAIVLLPASRRKQCGSQSAGQYIDFGTNIDPEKNKIRGEKLFYLTKVLR